MTAALFGALDAVNGAMLVYFVLLNGIYLIAGILAHRTLRRYVRRLQTIHIESLVEAHATPAVTIIATAFNEAATCVESAQSLLTLQYHDYEVLFINDGSTDATLARMTEAYGLRPAPRAVMSPLPSQPVRGVYRSTVHPNLWVIDKQNGGKADAMNAGLTYSRAPLYCAVDADGLLERDALMRIVRPFLEDRRVVAAGGIIRIINGCTVENGAVSDVKLPRNLFARLQVLEYLRAFLGWRLGWNRANAVVIISGAFGMFRRDVVVAAGGYATGSLGEDLELVIRLHRFCTDRGIPYRIQFVPDPVAWTQCPEDLGSLGRQRMRWHRGLTECMMKYHDMIYRPRYRALGMMSLPFLFFLETLGPALELLAYAGFITTLALGRVDARYVFAFFLVAFALGALLSVVAVALEERAFARYRRRRDLARLLLLSLVDVLGYRQLNSWWRLRGLWDAVRGAKASWGAMKRQRFQAGST